MYGARCIRYMWNLPDLAFQSELLTKFSQDLKFVTKKGSLGPGLDAPELEMSQVLPGSANREL